MTTLSPFLILPLTMLPQCKKAGDPCFVYNADRLDFQDKPEFVAHCSRTEEEEKRINEEWEKAPKRPVPY